MASEPLPAVKANLRIAAGWLARPPGRRVAVALALAIACQALFAIVDTLTGLPLVREAPAALDAGTWLQAAVAALTATLLAASLTAARSPGCALDRYRLSRSERAAAWLALALAAAATLLFVVNPAAFHAWAQEDLPLEWASALLLLGASLLFARQAIAATGAADRNLRAARIAIPAALALGLFVIGMEEVSWMQRLFGFATPAGLAEANWQGEFNLHNVQTDLSEFAYYVGAGLFLALLPLVRGIAAPALAMHPLARFVPGRAAAAVAAPAVLFTYGQWNLFAFQWLTALTAAMLVINARAAARRGDAVEVWLLWCAALAIAAGQCLFLALGPTMIDVPDASEYRELFVAAGFACHALLARHRRN